MIHYRHGCLLSNSGAIITHAERKERRAKIAAMIAKGSSISQVAAKFGVHAATIRSACGEHDVELPISLTQVTRTYVIIADLLNTEDSIGAIARKRGCTKQNCSLVYRACLAAGIEIKQRKPCVPTKQEPAWQEVTE